MLINQLINQLIKLSSFILHLFYVFNHLFAVAIIASGLRTVQNLRRLDTLFLQWRQASWKHRLAYITR